MASHSNQAYVSAPAYMLRNDRPSPTRVRNDRDRGPADRMAPANAQFPEPFDQSPFHRPASTSLRCQYARETNVASLDAMQSVILFAIAALRNAIAADSTRDLDQAKARRCEQLYQLRHQRGRDVPRYRVEQAH